jgi:hypothetical protein
MQNSTDLEWRVVFPPSWKVLWRASWGRRVCTVFSSSVNFSSDQNSMLSRLLRTRSVACDALYVYFSTETRKTTRKIWVNNGAKTYRYGHMPLLRELRENDPEDFKNDYGWIIQHLNTF